ncbi:hypothetical protein ACPFL9_09720 [Paenarthrobacter sp. NyZ202]|uniref:hypothetical protein n=1 Tax=Paenarthrobacter sp. NyZ202 TaxID=3402689 RepID=UPI003CF72B40
MGTAMQVLKEENHFDVLVNYVPPGGTGLLLVSLHREIRALKNGNERTFVEVRIDGNRVGELSNVTSAHLLPLLEHTETVGETTRFNHGTASESKARQSITRLGRRAPTGVKMALMG